MFQIILEGCEMNCFRCWLATALAAGACLALAALCVAGAQTNPKTELVWPQEWVAFGPVAPTQNMAAGGLPDRASLLPGEALKTIPEQLVIGGKTFRRRKVSLDGAGRLDLGNLLGGVLRGKVVYLLAPLKVDKDIKVKMGAGADWWMQWWLNGEVVFDTLRTGNEKAPIATDNHVFEVSLTKGEHVLAVAVISGSSSFVFAAGDPALRAPEPSAYVQAMAAGRDRYTGGGHTRHTKTEPGGLCRDFRRALDLATTDIEKAEALLGIGRAYLADVKETDYAVIRAGYAKVLALKTFTPQQRAEAHLGIAETYLAEKNYAMAREACARARAATSETDWIAQAQMVLARSYLQERKYPTARQQFERLLEMEGLERQLKWEAEALLKAIYLLPRVRTDHPRLFFNAETWPSVRERALTVEKAYFDRMKAKMDSIALEEIRSGDWASPDFGSGQVGVMEAAFVYRVTGDPVVLDKVRRMLRATADNRWDGDSAYPSIRWVAALDWVWNDLAPPEREALADAMLRYAHSFVSELKTGKEVSRRWLGGWPHYYLASMFGYAGIALLDPAADDVTYARALSLLGIGFKQHQERFASLIRTSGDDGVWQTNIEYDFCAVPNAVFPFLYAWQPLTGSKMPNEWVDVGVSPNFALRMVIGMGKGHIKHFNYAGHSNGAWGFGQVYSSALYDHLGHFMHFFGQSDPQQAAIANYLRRQMVEAGAGPAGGVYPVFQFLMTDLEKAPGPALPPGLPLARFFESVGLVLMSSGFGPEDTYALFSQGGGVPFRRHDWDATHFSIYKKGFLALDTGARFALPHSPNYRHQTVAHNAVLIHMPAERFPRSQTGPVIANTGGQNRYPHDARGLAFETDRLYAYTATDATPVYNEEKCAQMVRQFIYLPPDHFVVFDRVTSKKAEYAKTWLLHTANEPTIAGKEFRANQDQGRIFCRTLYPLDAKLEKIGGPGKEFWADGRNWPIVHRFQSPGSGDWWERYGRGYAEPPEAMGRWRVEVKPGQAREEDYLLHLIQVSDQTLEKMVASKVSETANQVQLTFTVGARTYTLSLNKTGEVGGHIRITEDRQVLLDRDLTREIMPQSGLALVK